MLKRADPKTEEPGPVIIADIPTIESLYRTLNNINLALLILAGVVALAIGLVSVLTAKKANELMRAKDQMLLRDLKDKDIEIAKANARAAEANEKAEQERLARLKIEQKIAPRTLTSQQQATIASKLSRFAAERADISWQQESFEGGIFAKQIGAALTAARWSVNLAPAPAGVNGMPIVSGVMIMTGPNDTSISVGAELLAVLQAEGVTAFSMPLVRFFPSFAGIDPHSTDPYATRVLIVIGNKP